MQTLWWDRLLSWPLDANIERFYTEKVVWGRLKGSPKAEFTIGGDEVKADENIWRRG
jgi:hypothetical protein